MLFSWRFYFSSLIAISCSVVTVFSESNWTVRNPFPSTQSIRKIVWTGNGYFAIDWSNLHTSPDGKNWKHQPTGLTQPLNDIVWAGTTLVGITDSMIYRSGDGKTWTACLSQVAPTVLNCVRKVDSLLFVWASAQVNEAKMYISRNGGGVWEEHSINQTGVAPKEHIHDICRYNGKFVAVGDGSGQCLVFYSNDGISWVRDGDLNISGTLTGISCLGNTLIAVGSNNIVLTSQEYLKWNKVTLPLLDTLGFSGLATNASVLVAVNAKNIATTSNGIDWNINGLRPCNYDLPASIVWTGDKFLIAGQKVAVSADGRKWEVVLNSESGDLYSICWTGTAFYTIGENWNSERAGKSLVLRSSDGISWDRCSTGVNESLYSIEWIGDKLVAVGEKGTIVTSADGNQWTRQQAELPYDYCNVEWNGALAVVLGFDNTSSVLLSSDDGIAWTERIRTTIDLTKISYCNDKYIVATMSPETTFISDDGKIWRMVLCPEFTSGWYSVAWTGSSYVTAASNSFLVSTDLTNWKGVPTGATEGDAWEFFTFIRVGDSILAVGGNWGDKYSLIFRSHDGIQWDRYELPPSEVLYDISLGNGLLVAVGCGGFIMTAPCNFSSKIVKKGVSQPSRVPPTLVYRNSKLHLSFPGRVEMTAQAVLYDLSGKKIAEPVFTTFRGSADIQADRMAGGRYIMQVYAGKEKMTLPFTVGK